MRFITTVAVLIATLSALASCLSAAESTCDHCGCHACVRRVCVPKIVEKEVTKICWDVKCEDVCVPGPSKKICTKCQSDACGCYTFDVWQPTCAKVKTRRVPVKTEVKRKVPRIEWTVEYRCDGCCQACNHAPELPPAETSPAPVPPPTLK